MVVVTVGVFIPTVVYSSGIDRSELTKVVILDSDWSTTGLKKTTMPLIYHVFTRTMVVCRCRMLVVANLSLGVVSGRQRPSIIGMAVAVVDRWIAVPHIMRRQLSGIWHLDASFFASRSNRSRGRIRSRRLALLHLHRTFRCQNGKGMRLKGLLHLCYS